MPRLPRIFSHTPPPVRVALCLALAFTACKRDEDPTIPAEPGPNPTGAEALPGFEVGPPAAIGDRSDVPHERFFVELGDAPVRGPTDAAVTVIAFSDFECPYCQRGHETLLELEREYHGKIRIAYKAFPLDFHPHAMIAALAVRTAQAEGKFWQFHDRLLSQRGLDFEKIQQYAQEVGLNLDVLAQDLQALKYGASVRRDMRQAYRLGVRGTPAYYINGRRVSGAKPKEVLREMIDEEIALADQWRAKGIAGDKLYAYAIEDGYREVAFKDARKRLRPDKIYNVPVGSAPQRGPATAPVTIIAFGDFECPFCARGNDTVEQMRLRYGNQVRVVYRNYPLPFHSHAFLAARGSMYAQAQGKFWEFHDALYALRAEFDEDVLVEVARKVGMAAKPFREALHSDRFDAKILGDQNLARKVGVTGTPAYFVNGRVINGAAPPLEFRLAIEEELQRASAAIASGVAPEKLYEHLVSEQAL